MGNSRQCVGIRSLRNRWLEGKSDPTLCIGHTTGASERYTGDGTRGTVSTRRVGVTLHRLLVLDTRFTGGWCRAHRDHLSTDQFCRERASRPSECASLPPRDNDIVRLVSKPVPSCNHFVPKHITRKVWSWPGSPPSPRRCSEKALDPRHAPESVTTLGMYITCT